VIAAVLATILLPATSDQLPSQPFFASDSVFEVTVRANLRQLLRDRDPDTNIWREGTMLWRDGDSTRAIRTRLRTRGLYRLRECDFPPLRLRISQEDARGTIWANIRRPKLVTHCEDNGSSEQQLLQEYAIYRVLRLLTPVTFQARLLRVTYEDSAGQRRPVTRYGIVTEDPERLFDRLGGNGLEQQGVGFVQLNPGNVALLSVFQYFIANTDWSLPGLHNIQLVRLADGLYAMPYDFDWAGTIGAPYARPAAILPIRSVRERIWRGPCLSAAQLEPTLARFEQLRDSIQAVYGAIPGLEPGLAERARRYNQEFFDAIRDRARFEQRVVRPDCIR